MVSSAEDGVDIARSLVSQLAVGEVVARGLTVAEAAGPDSEKIPRHSAINSAVRVRTSFPTRILTPQRDAGFYPPRDARGKILM